MPLTPARITHFLSSTDYFAEVDLLSLSAIGNRFEVVSVSRGETLFEEGDPGRAWFIIVEGLVSISGQTATGASMDLASLGPGDGFGEIALLENIERSATATAVERTTLARLPREAFQRLLRDGNPAAAMMLHAMAVRMSRQMRVLSKALQERGS